MLFWFSFGFKSYVILPIKDTSCQFSFDFLLLLDTRPSYCSIINSEMKKTWKLIKCSFVPECVITLISFAGNIRKGKKCKSQCRANGFAIICFLQCRANRFAINWSTVEIACGRLVTGTALIEKEEKDVSPQNRVKNAQLSRNSNFLPWMSILQRFIHNLSCHWHYSSCSGVSLY